MKEGKQKKSKKKGKEVKKKSKAKAKDGKQKTSKDESPRAVKQKKSKSKSRKSKNGNSEKENTKVADVEEEENNDSNSEDSGQESEEVIYPDTVNPKRNKSRKSRTTKADTETTDSKAEDSNSNLDVSSKESDDVIIPPDAESYSAVPEKSKSRKSKMVTSDSKQEDSETNLDENDDAISNAKSRKDSDTDPRAEMDSGVHSNFEDSSQISEDVAGNETDASTDQTEGRVRVIGTTPYPVVGQALLYKSRARTVTSINTPLHPIQPARKSKSTKVPAAKCRHNAGQPQHPGVGFGAHHHANTCMYCGSNGFSEFWERTHTKIETRLHNKTSTTPMIKARIDDMTEIYELRRLKAMAVGQKALQRSKTLGHVVMR